MLALGETRKVDFTLDERNVRYWNSVERDRVIDPGEFDIWVGNNSTAQARTTFRVGGQPRQARRPVCPAWLTCRRKS